MLTHNTRTILPFPYNLSRLLVIKWKEIQTQYSSPIPSERQKVDCSRLAHFSSSQPPIPLIRTNKPIPSYLDGMFPRMSIPIHASALTSSTIVGQFYDSFIIVRHAQSLYIIDQHAADERIKLEALETQMHTLSGAFDLVSGLDIPTNNNLADYCKLNITIKYHRILTLPKLLFENIAVLQRDLHDVNLMNDFIHDLLCSKACHSAVKAGNELNLNQMTLIVNSLAACNKPGECAHGRPTVQALLHDTRRKDSFM